MKLDVCIIATVRPEVLQMTLRSFTKNLLNQFDCRAIINVDPAGDIENHSQTDVVNLCRENFDEVIYRTPETPSFAGAVQWVWQQVQTEFFFHLEDDWILRRKLDQNKLLSLFEDPAVVATKLNKFNRKRMQQRINAGHVTRINDGIVSRNSIGLGPGFMRTAYIRQIAIRMELDKDPEFQYEEDTNKLITDDYLRPTFLQVATDKKLTISTGGKWMRSKSIRKICGSDMPTTWGSLDDKTIFRTIRHRICWHIKKRIWQIRYC